MLPVKEIVIETAAFDTQLLKTQEEGKPIPQGNDYQQGEQLGSWNVREYVLFRDGHITKNTRIQNDLSKEHYIDARCISGHPKAESDGIYYYQKKVRCHNQQIHKYNNPKGGVSAAL